MHVRDACLTIAFLDEVRNRVHEMRLTETDTAVKKQRVIGTARILGNLEGRGLSELVALAFDETREVRIRVQPCAYNEPFGSARAHGRGCGRNSASHRGTPGSDLHRDDRHVTRALITQKIADPRQ